jgi:hypothetical protein
MRELRRLWLGDTLVVCSVYGWVLHRALCGVQAVVKTCEWIHSNGFKQHATLICQSEVGLVLRGLVKRSRPAWSGPE